MGTEVQGAVAQQRPGPPQPVTLTAHLGSCVSAVLFWDTLGLASALLSGVVKVFSRSKSVVIDEVKNKGFLRKGCLSSIASV